MKLVLFLLNFTIVMLALGCRIEARQKEPAWVGAGDLLVDGEKPLPLKHTDVRIRITGLVASVQVEQVFTNPLDERIEAVYTFPLPAQAAVYDMSMKIGDRIIRRVVKRREEARRLYERAKRTGRRAGLLEQERPNIFTTSVANIAPGDEVRIRLHFFQVLPYDDGGFRLRFPMVVAPRFIPGEPTGKQGTGWSPDTTDVPDASRVTPPVLKPEMRPGYNISLSVDIESGLPIQHLQCPSHRISIAELGPGHSRVELVRKDEFPNRDFVLEYQLAGDHIQATALTARDEDGKGYFLLMVVPPIDYVIDEIQSKEITFIIDTSGSMTGAKIEQAKNALRALIHGLNPQDAFNIIRFSNNFSAFAPRPVPFTQENVDRADAYIDELQAGGGTMMLPPLLHALDQPHDEHRLPLIVFLTDGQVGNEAQILRAVKQRVGRARIYTFGVDTAPNDYLLRKMAEFGRGTFEFVLPSQDLEEVITRFQNRIASPVLTDVSVDWGGLSVDGVYPTPLPDVFLARPLVLIGRVWRPEAKTVKLRGQSVAGPIERSLRVTFDHPTADALTLSTLWARARIEALSDRLVAHPDDEAAKQEIIQLALTHKLMSPFTAFVAVEEKTVRSAEGGPPKTIVVPVPLPEGWDYEAVFGRERRAPIGNAAAFMSPALTAAPARDISGGVIGGVVAESARAHAGPPIAMPSPAPTASPPPARDLVSLATKEDRLRAVARYLLRHQRVNGVWMEASQRQPTVGAIQTTAITLLAYLANGHTDRAGSYQAQVRRALDYLIHTLRTPLWDQLPGSEGGVRAHALATWAMVESFAATHSSRYRTAATEMLHRLLKLRVNRGLWPDHIGGPVDATTSTWALLAARSARRAGLSIDDDIFSAAARAIKAASSLPSFQRRLIQVLAGRSLSSNVARALATKLVDAQLTVTEPEHLESLAMKMILARLLGGSTSAQLEAKALEALQTKQSARGKQAGGFQLDAGSPIATSARAFLLLSIAHAQWAALQ